MNKYLTKSIYKLALIIGEKTFYIKRYLVLSMIWEFRGLPRKLGINIVARSIGGVVSIGKKAVIGPCTNIDCRTGAKIMIGENVSINQGTFVVALNEIRIGSNVLIGEYCSIRDNDHAWKDSARLIRNQGFTDAPIVIGDDVWLGRGVVVCKGVQIGKGSVVGANAVVTRNVPPYSLVVGVPAHPIAARTDLKSCFGNA